MTAGNLFSRVLIPLDGSKHAERALETLSEVPTAAELVVVAVISPRLLPEGSMLALASAEEYLRGVCASFQDGSWRLTAEVRTGDAAEEILRAAEQHKPSLVVMSTHGRSGFVRLVRGSVTERVLRNCRVPLLMLNPTARFEPPKTILVPHDGSDTADQVLDPVISLARAFTASVTLFRVQAPRFASFLPTQVDPELSTPDRVEAQLAAETLDRQLQLLQSAGVEANVERARGESGPAPAILEAAERFDLVALASHGRSGWSRWSLGSVAESTLRACPCPVLVQRITSPSSTAEGASSA